MRGTNSFSAVIVVLEELKFRVSGCHSEKFAWNEINKESRYERLRNEKSSRTEHVVRIYELPGHENNSIHELSCYMKGYISFFTYDNLGFCLQ